ncbi:MAG: sigma-54 dependent transcriptional regulator [Spirochaetales bacterium]|nr:sigma-54 dependent transcriptional regulator [Spirochaetales bacterium]MCF7937724.1 sigma-54 dependent transcriptional regulator [Spirochaetales bacterium]
MYRLLITSRDRELINSLRAVLPPVVYSSVVSRPEYAERIVAAQKEPFDCLLIDHTIQKSDCVKLIEAGRNQTHHIIIILLTESHETSFLVECTKAGADTILNKPVQLSELKEAAHKLFNKYHFLKKQALSEESPPLRKLIGRSPPLREIKSQVVIYARAEKNVLLTGESGTGKDVVAKTIHKLSSRKNGPYVPENCGAIPESLLSTELFGSERGAYTGAVSRPGSFEAADGGTLFLDEIGEMGYRSQASFLRVLEEHTVRRIGARKNRPINTRVIAATNTNLKRAAAAGHFRQDLYYRLNTLPIHIPPLRDRREDIPLLASYFLGLTTAGIEAGSEFESVADHGPGKPFGPGVMDKLVNYHWPGNIRELRNVIDRAVLISGERIEVEHIRFL